MQSSPAPQSSQQSLQSPAIHLSEDSSLSDSELPLFEEEPEQSQTTAETEEEQITYENPYNIHKQLIINKQGRIDYVYYKVSSLDGDQEITKLLIDAKRKAYIRLVESNELVAFYPNVSTDVYVALCSSPRIQINKYSIDLHDKVNELMKKLDVLAQRYKLEEYMNRRNEKKNVNTYLVLIQMWKEIASLVDKVLGKVDGSDVYEQHNVKNDASRFVKFFAVYWSKLISGRDWIFKDVSVHALFEVVQERWVVNMGMNNAMKHRIFFEEHKTFFTFCVIGGGQDQMDLTLKELENNIELTSDKNKWDFRLDYCKGANLSSEKMAELKTELKGVIVTYCIPFNDEIKILRSYIREANKIFERLQKAYNESDSSEINSSKQDNLKMAGVYVRGLTNIISSMLVPFIFGENKWVREQRRRQAREIMVGITKHLLSETEVCTSFKRHVFGEMFNFSTEIIQRSVVARLQL